MSLLLIFQVELQETQGTLEEYYNLLNQYRDIHWIFMVSSPLSHCSGTAYAPEKALLSEMEPIEGVINAIRAEVASQAGG